MEHVKVLDRSVPITAVGYDLVVAPCNQTLAVSGIHSAIPMVISEHRYLLGQQGKIRDENPIIRSGDTFVVANERPQLPDLLYAVLAMASEVEPEKQLERFYTNLLEKAVMLGAKTIGIPSLSTGIFGYPERLVVDVGKLTFLKFKQFDRIGMHCYNDSYYKLFSEQTEVQ
ncbi:macro domain-containing protein [Maribacter sp. 2-571]|uniref:macro domain-containing protein n=1 Tax=Maribacter sp. 2-571 TaxID=3417569 RepID=UPI003D338F5D